MSLKGSFPIPVLGSHDDISGELKVECQVRQESIKTVIEIQLELRNAGIEAQVEDGSASYSIRLSCPKTYFRRSYVQSSPNFVIHVDNDEILGLLTISGRVTSTRHIEEYRPSGLNDDYGDESFFVTPGQLLAFSSDCTVILEEGFDPLRNPDASLLQISQDSNLSSDQPFAIDFESNKIQIAVSPESFRRYRVVKDLVPMTLHMSLVVPVIAEAIRLMRDNTDEYSDYKWHEVLSQHMAANQLDVQTHSPLEMAQKLLDSPHNKAFQELEDVLTSEEPEE